MANLKKAAKELIQPKLETIFDDIDAVLRKHDIHDYSLKEFRIIHKDDLEQCPCGEEKIILPSGKIVTRCKKCPPPQPPA